MEWVKSALEEGNEEVIQGIISNLTAGAVYDKDKELFSLDNEDAVINPKRMLEEGAMGAAVGGILGGGQMTFQNIVNASANSEYKKIGKTVKIVNSTDEVIDYAKHSVDPEIRALALKSEPSKVSDEVAGRLYAYACRDINQAINSPESLNVAIDNFNEIAENSDDGFITSIAASQMIRRLMSAGIDEDSARYMTEQSNLNDTEPTGTDVNTTGTHAELKGAEGATETEDDNSVLHDPEIGDIATKLDMFDTYKGSDGEQHMKTSRHKHIESAVEKTGAKLIWSSNVSRGKYIPSTKTIMLNPEMSTAEAYNFVLKHEFTHYLKSKKGYDGFKDYVFNDSQYFDDWARARLDKAGIDNTGSKKQVMERLTEAYYNNWVNSNELSEYLRKKFTLADAEEEILADFVGENLLGTKEKLDDTLHMLSDLKQKNRSIFEKIRDFIRDLIHKFKGDKSFKGLVNDLEYLNNRLERLAQSEENKKASATEGEEKYSIVALDNGNTYVKASRNVISGNDISEWRKQITSFFNELLDGGESLDINTIGGDVLTITKSETANKARDNYKNINGQRNRMSDSEFKVKLNAEAHIDEIAETSIGSQNKKSDTKSHNFAKDGFTYRTAYFQDFDGTYYRLKLSVGNNGTVATVYNVGKINKDSLPSLTKIVSVVGSKPLGKLSSDSISNSAENVKKNNSESVKKDTESIPKLDERVSGDELLNAEDLIDEVKSVGGDVDANGYITLYHRTTEQAKEKILSSGKMTAKEDGIFFSTKEDGQADGYGDAVIEMRIPAEKLVLDDIFDDEAHLRYPLESRKSVLDISEYIISESTENYSENSNDIENLLFDEEFYKTFENEDKTVITESLEELQTQLEEMTDENSTWDEQYEVRQKIKALKEGYKSVYDYYVGHQKENVLKEYKNNPDKFKEKFEKSKKPKPRQKRFKPR